LGSKSIGLAPNLSMPVRADESSTTKAAVAAVLGEEDI